MKSMRIPDLLKFCQPTIDFQIIFFARYEKYLWEIFDSDCIEFVD